MSALAWLAIGIVLALVAPRIWARIANEIERQRRPMWPPQDEVLG